MPEKILSIRPAYDAKKEAEKNTFGIRLAEARREKGWSLKYLAEMLNDYNIHVWPSAVNKWEQGTTTPNPYQIFSLCRIFDLEDGVRYFSGPLHPGETALNEQGLKKIEEYRNDLIASGRYSSVSLGDASEEEVEKPLYELPVSAGTGNFLDSAEYHMEFFQASTVPAKADFALTVSGDSMMPNYTNGQMVWVQETPELHDNEIGIFVLNGCAYMKKYRETKPTDAELTDSLSSEDPLLPKVALVSLNKKYPPIQIGEYDEFRIIGRVLT